MGTTMDIIKRQDDLRKNTTNVSIPLHSRFDFFIKKID